MRAKWKEVELMLVSFVVHALTRSFMTGLAPLPTPCAAAPTYPRFNLSGRTSTSLTLGPAPSRSYAGRRATSDDADTSFANAQVRMPVLDVPGARAESQANEKEAKRRTSAPILSLFRTGLDGESHALDRTSTGESVQEDAARRPTRGEERLAVPRFEATGVRSRSFSSVSGSNPTRTVSPTAHSTKWQLDDKATSIRVLLLQQGTEIRRREALRMLDVRMRQRLHDALSSGAAAGEHSESSQGGAGPTRKVALNKEIIEVVAR